uniref:Uncharacterized protein n=1 Tax=Setaria viridis TaxID=4556 RepID=A0A4U6WAI3_SETVI|nr:hypothetical protein SEVIR_1G128301v2 [Setaria viridis]
MLLPLACILLAAKARAFGAAYFVNADLIRLRSTPLPSRSPQGVEILVGVRSPSAPN